MSIYAHRDLNNALMNQNERCFQIYNLVLNYLTLGEKINVLVVRTWYMHDYQYRLHYLNGKC